MGYDAEIVRRARARLAAQRAESEQEQIRRTQEVYERFPRVKEIDQALRATVAQVVSAAFRTGEDPQRAVAQAQAENRKLQQERAWILEAAELGGLPRPHRGLPHLRRHGVCGGRDVPVPQRAVSG